MKSRSRITVKDILPQISFSTSKSSGPGGQNVNKVNSKVTLSFDVTNSQLLTEEQRDLILNKLASRISKEGILSINAQSKRS